MTGLRNGYPWASDPAPTCTRSPLPPFASQRGSHPRGRASSLRPKFPTCSLFGWDFGSGASCPHSSCPFCNAGEAGSQHCSLEKSRGGPLRQTGTDATDESVCRLEPRCCLPPEAQSPGQHSPIETECESHMEVPIF